MSDSNLESSQRQRLNTLANDHTWIDQAANLLLFGASGLGKSHIAAAVGHALIDQGLWVRYYPASNLVQELQTAKQGQYFPGQHDGRGRCRPAGPSR